MTAHITLVVYAASVSLTLAHGFIPLVSVIKRYYIVRDLAVVAMTLAYASYAKLQILRHRFVQEAFILALFLIGLLLVLTSLVADPLNFWKFWITLYTPVYACVVTIVLIVLSAYLVQLVGKRSGTIARNLLIS